MGVNTDAILLWGFDLGEDFDWPDDEDAFKTYWQAKDDAIKTTGCELVWHCSTSCPMWAVAVTDSVLTAIRGCPEEVTSLDVGPGWEERLRAFCELLGIEWKRPGWLLVSYWG